MTDPKTTERDGDFERRAKRMFDQSVGSIDAATRSRLTQARHRALQQLERPRTRAGWLWAPAGGLALAALAAVMLFERGGPAPEVGLQASTLDDLEILLGDQDLEMLDEEIEFYAWLEEQPEFAAPAATGDGVG